MEVRGTPPKVTRASPRRFDHSGWVAEVRAGAGLLLAGLHLAVILRAARSLPRTCVSCRAGPSRRLLPVDFRASWPESGFWKSVGPLVFRCLASCFPCKKKAKRSLLSKIHRWEKNHPPESELDEFGCIERMALASFFKPGIP